MVPDSAPWTFGFAEHVMGIWGRELYPDAEAGGHMAGNNSFKHIVRVEFYDRCERASLGVMACMKVFDVLHDSFSSAESSLDLRNHNHM
jgi:hypothetical protein